MAQSYQGRYVSSRRRRRRVAPFAAVIILLVSVGVFAGGFALFYNLGSRVAAGGGLFPGSGDGQVAVAAEPERVTERYPFLDGPNLEGFRDRSYVPVKGIYVSSWAAGSSKRMPELLDLCDRTEINAMVIDVKDDTGYVCYNSSVALSKDLGLEENRLKDVPALIQTLRDHNIIPIARLVAFKDPILAEKRPDLAVMDKSGDIWRDYKGFPFTNPYNREVWDYLVDVAEDVADLGFREIQFDYVRFPSDGKISDAVYPGKSGTHEDAIAAFLNYARERLEKKGVWVSADVFGLTVHVKDDLGIGQKIEKVALNSDIVCPMIYPSHYYSGAYNVKDPNRSPYDIVTYATLDASRRLAGTGAIYRPWLQDFSLGGVQYGVAEVKAQIKAVEEQGYHEWILWDPSLRYTEGALRSN
jgi:hypothetical protein